ncbi:MAG: hypothetical protein A2X31_01370 [Elusimicrobia bacterium GWB2_63_22]|nr:MAG: hypothetical protein A2X31_01370 [Elusimicrobia bacterium GWB2_63_22]
MACKGDVLIIDDDPDLLDLISFAFSHSGYRVATAANGAEGVAMIRAGNYDLAILDMMMPEMDGLSALREIKKSGVGTEIVMLTAHISVDTAVESMRLGAFDYLKKPFQLDQLEAVAEKAVEKRRLAVLARAALSAGAPNGLMEAVTTSALTLLGADEALVLLDSGGAGLHLAASAGIEGEERIKYRFELCARGRGLLAEAGAELLTVAPAGEARLKDLPGAAEVASAIFIPLAEGGLLCACRLGAGAPFGEKEMRRAKTLGPLISLALKNSQLSSQLRSVRIQLAQTQKMESLGLLTGQISHDFNNLLAVITGSVQLMMENMKPGVGMKLSEDILHMAKEAESLIKQLLLFARRDEAPAVPSDLNAVLGDVKLIIEKIAGKEMPVEYALAPALPKVRVKPDHFKQVVINLASNARKSTAGKGRLFISTRQTAAAEPLPAGLRAGAYVVMEVADEGAGISQESMKRLFEPFFTTRAAGQGTGLGLHIVRNILREYGGEIQAGNREGGGAVFRVFLPACAA